MSESNALKTRRLQQICAVDGVYSVSVYGLSRLTPAGQRNARASISGVKPGHMRVMQHTAFISMIYLHFDGTFFVHSYVTLYLHLYIGEPYGKEQRAHIEDDPPLRWRRASRRHAPGAGRMCARAARKARAGHFPLNGACLRAYMHDRIARPQNPSAAFLFILFN